MPLNENEAEIAQTLVDLSNITHLNYHLYDGDVSKRNINRTRIGIQTHQYLKNSNTAYNPSFFEFAVRSFDYFQSLQPTDEKKETPDFLSVLWYILEDSGLKLPQNVMSLMKYDRNHLIKDAHTIEIELKIMTILRKKY
jgi:hypothetical protein